MEHPHPGERCTCGRPAVVVYRTRFGRVPYCGQPAAESRKILDAKGGDR